MDATRFPHALLAVALGLVASPKVPYLEAATTNVPPRISIVRPPPPSATDGVGLFLKIKAEASDPDGTIAAVQFMVGTNTIGLVTNAPFNVLWFAGYDEPAGGPYQPGKRDTGVGKPSLLVIYQHESSVGQHVQVRRVLPRHQCPSLLPRRRAARVSPEQATSSLIANFTIAASATTSSASNRSAS